MSIFRLQQNVPDAYVRPSRDFQLLCNSFDAVYNAVKNDIDSIVNTADTRLCSDRLLPLLQTKLGFFTDKQFSAKELRIVLQAFSYIVKNKGSRIGILAAIEVYLKVMNASRKSRVTIIDKYVEDGYITDKVTSNTYVIEVGIEGTKLDTTLLTELLRYVLPAGYTLRYSFYHQPESISNISVDDTINIVFVNTADARGVRAYNRNPDYLNVQAVSTAQTLTTFDSNGELNESYKDTTTVNKWPEGTEEDLNIE